MSRSLFLLCFTARLACVLVFVEFISISSASAEALEPQRRFLFTIENDAFGDDDSGYSSGLGISWGYGPLGSVAHERVPGWLSRVGSRLSYSSDDQLTHAVSYQVAQGIYTPQDIKTPDLIIDDRPYAGVLLWSTSLQSYDKVFANRYELMLGVVGPASGAREVQRSLHKVLETNVPQGWHNQLNNEFVFLLANERLYRLADGLVFDTLEFDFIGLGGVAVGTFRSEVGGGVGFRVGRNLLASFPSAGLIPGRQVNVTRSKVQIAQREWHMFANLYARYVFNDITLDGNYFSDSHGVTLRHPQAVGAIGIEWNHSRWSVQFSAQETSRTFEERKEKSLFFTVSVNHLM